jgi:glutaryl-CoA dehydrogenase
LLPRINDFWERAELPWPLIEKAGSLDPMSIGAVNVELHRDGSLGTPLGVRPDSP